MATTTNYSWTTPDDTALVKDGAAAIRSLGTSIDTTTKNLNPSTTLGDIEYRSSTANTNTRLGIGSTGNVLTVSGGVPSWAAPAAGGGMTLLSTTTLSGATTTISSISQSYTDLYVAVYGMTFNTDGYTRIYLRNSSTNQNITQLLSYDADAGATTSNSTRILPVGFSAQKAAQSGNHIGLQIRNYTEAVANYRNFFWSGYHNYSDAGATVKAYEGGGGVIGSSAIDTLHFEAAGGATSFSSGTVKIWGIK